jgi:hypothetical protein
MRHQNGVHTTIRTRQRGNAVGGFYAAYHSVRVLCVAL